MADTTKLHVALQSAREMEIEVADAAAVRTALETALEQGDKIIWVVDTRGHEFGFIVDKLAFMEFEGERSRPSVGFGAVT